MCTISILRIIRMIIIILMHNEEKTLYEESLFVKPVHLDLGFHGRRTSKRPWGSLSESSRSSKKGLGFRAWGLGYVLSTSLHRF